MIEGGGGKETKQWVERGNLKTIRQKRKSGGISKGVSGMKKRITGGSDGFNSIQEACESQLLSGLKRSMFLIGNHYQCIQISRTLCTYNLKQEVRGKYKWMTNLLWYLRK